MKSEYKEYGWDDAEASHMHAHFMPHVVKLAGPLSPQTRVLDVGCGNGFTCGEFLRLGCRSVVGVDLSEEGVSLARKTYPDGRFEVLGADANVLRNLHETFFDVVVSTEVVEHIYDPRGYTRGCYTALKPGGRFICTTPYHGYLKNLTLALLNKWDHHANPLWDGGHIKFWSRNTLSKLFTETGFKNLQFRGAGRFPWLWMTMVMSGDKPL